MTAATDGCTVWAPTEMMGTFPAASTHRRATVAQPVEWARVPQMAVSYRPKVE